MCINQCVIFITICAMHRKSTHLKQQERVTTQFQFINFDKYSKNLEFFSLKKDIS